MSPVFYFLKNAFCIRKDSGTKYNIWTNTYYYYFRFVRNSYQKCHKPILIIESKNKKYMKEGKK